MRYSLAFISASRGLLRVAIDLTVRYVACLLSSFRYKDASGGDKLDNIDQIYVDRLAGLVGFNYVANDNNNISTFTRQSTIIDNCFFFLLVIA